MIGFLSAQGVIALMLPYALGGALLFGGIAYGLQTVEPPLWLARLGTAALLFGIGLVLKSFSYGVLLALIGFVLGGLALWLASAHQSHAPSGLHSVVIHARMVLKLLVPPQF